MSTVSELLMLKGSDVLSISPSASVLEAIRRMNQHQIGALVVIDKGRVVGMFTERDVLRRVMSEMLAPHRVTVGQVMTTEVICCKPDISVAEAGQLMKDRRIRHIPVCDPDGTLHGVISIGDLNAFYVSAQEQTIHSLTDYIYGRV
jgi:CBS domain-containing protein